MAKHEPARLTPTEASVMDAVWGEGEATVRQAHEKLDSIKPRAYNTVLTVMRILRQKGFLKSERRGRTDVYTPTVTRNEMACRAVKEVTDRFFACSPAALVSFVVKEADLAADEVKAVRREADRRLRELAPRKRKRG